MNMDTDTQNQKDCIMAPGKEVSYRKPSLTKKAWFQGYMLKLRWTRDNKGKGDTKTE